jgi:hypothetical protein
VNKILGFLTLSLFLFSSCFEIVEEVDLKSNGSGHLTYTLNLSQSKERLHTIMALDSISGMNVPSKQKIEGKIQAAMTVISGLHGISNPLIKKDYENFIFVAELDFESMEKLNAAVAKLHEELSPFGLAFKNVFVSTPEDLTRNIDVHTLNFLRFLEQKNRNILQNAQYTVIYRLEKPIREIEGKGIKSKNGRAAKFGHNLHEIAIGKDPMIHRLKF